MKTRPGLKKLIIPVIVMLCFWALAIWGFLASGYTQPLILFGYIGTSIGLGLGLYAVLPRKHKPWGRRLTLFLVGTFLIIFAIFMGMENTQIEGFFFALLAGVFQMALTHYLIAKIIGPVFFGRLWCGWACWTAMILDLLPFTCPSGRLPTRWGWVRYIHLAISLTIVLVLWFGFGFRNGAVGQTAVLWFIIGNVLYYLIGIILAFALKDNRAFCKYVCPITVPLKLTSRFAMLKIQGSREECNDCDACEKTCPMDIRISNYITQGKRVLSTECTLCQTCITACPKQTLKLSFGFDLGGKEFLRERKE